MNKKIIDLNYAKNRRKSILSTEEVNSNINTQITPYNVDMSLILEFHVDLSNLALGLTSDDVEIDDLIMILRRINDIAEFLEIDLISEYNPEETVKDPRLILNALFNSVSMLNYKKTVARSKIKNRIIPLFVNLVYSLGFTLEELEKTYKMQFSGE